VVAEHRQHHPGGDGAATGHAQHQPECRWAEAKALTDDQWQEGPGGRSKEKERTGTQDGRAHGRHGNSKAQPSAYRGWQALRWKMRAGRDGAAPNK
jgi:hypothetical protein